MTEISKVKEDVMNEILKSKELSVYTLYKNLDCYTYGTVIRAIDILQAEKKIMSNYIISKQNRKLRVLKII